ncbi:potassium voltage-gated channel subfamily A member 2 [Hydra vulgaris]|uniref:potassium voltage-gated channel subfamily A member 2 n=1 Tax=Hydra vulgaris TaxID=6087 RepID=UPI0001923D83|nr:potassium voltage-gated channel subfamily A member 2 [Hydra vulgaris]
MDLLVNKRVCFNISGKVFETFLETLNRYPCTLLGNDKSRAGYFNASKNIYFIDRSPLAFEAILFFYQSGCLIRPPFMSLELFEEECMFYNLGNDVIKSMKARDNNNYKKSRKSTMKPVTKLEKIWEFLEVPESSMLAQIFAVISVILAFLIVVVDCIVTLDIYQKPKMTILNRFTLFSNIFFALEFIARIISTPGKSKFIKSKRNLLDFFTILPNFLITLFEGKYAGEVNINILLIRFSRMFKILWIIRLIRYSKSFVLIATTLEILAKCSKDLFTLLFCVLITCTLCGNLIYFAELDDKTSSVVSAPEGMWLVIQTILTIGYGDVVPITVVGRFLTALTAAIGITVTFPLLSFCGKFFHAYSKIYKATNIK